MYYTQIINLLARTGKKKETDRGGQGDSLEATRLGVGGGVRTTRWLRSRLPPRDAAALYARYNTALKTYTLHSCSLSLCETSAPAPLDFCTFVERVLSFFFCFILYFRCLDTDVGILTLLGVTFSLSFFFCFFILYFISKLETRSSIPNGIYFLLFDLNKSCIQLNFSDYGNYFLVLLKWSEMLFRNFTVQTAFKQNLLSLRI